MIYSIVGTNVVLREKSNKEVAVLGKTTHHLYSEQVGELEALIDATSLFGGPVVVLCIQLSEVSSSKEELQRLLDSMSTSINIFIIDEPFADAHLVNRLQKVSKKLFDAREEKTEDTSVFRWCDLFVARNKKQTWVDFLELKKTETPEAIHGALWWKFQLEWSKVKKGKKSLFTEEDCKRIGKELMQSSILAHKGEKDLIVELERIILSL